MVSGAEKKKRRAAAAAASNTSDVNSPILNHTPMPAPSSQPTEPMSTSSSHSPNSAIAVILSCLPAPFDKYKDRIDPKVLAELYLEIGALYKGLDKAKHEKSWHEGYVVGLDLGKIEGRKEGSTQMCREVRVEIQDDLRRERMRRKCEVAMQTEPLPDSPPHMPSPADAAMSIHTSKPLNWAEDVDSALQPQSSLAPLATLPRDLSVLRSTSDSKPFGSLQQRNRRARHSASDAPMRTSQCRARPVDTASWRSSTHRSSAHHSSNFHLRSRLSRSHNKFNGRTSSRVKTVLDWDGDPRLADLGRVLTSLGWVRAS